MRVIIDFIIKNRVFTLELYERILTIQIILLATAFIMILVYDYSKKFAYKRSLTAINIKYPFEYRNLKNTFTEFHSQRVSNICYSIAKAMGLNKKQQQEVKLAGLMHDAGKIGIPDAILNKKEKLTDEEWNIIREHSFMGYDMLSSIDRLKHIAPYVLQHHERIDGKGYPNNLKSDEIELYSKIISIADAYDAMTSERAYSKAMTKQQSIEEIKNCSGTQFDSKIAKVFIELVV